MNKAEFQRGYLWQILVDIRSSLWFLPVLCILAALLLAFGLVELDRHVDDALRQRWLRLFEVEAEGARSILSTIAGSMATIAGVVFSITIVALTLASSQYTSRVLRNFMRDRANQIVLGIFIGVFLYCLLVLRTVSSGNGDFVPTLAVCVALVLAVLSCFAFIFFIHHISSTIQASEMVTAIHCETRAAIDQMYPDELGHGAAGRHHDVPESTEWIPVPALQMGYVQSISEDGLFDFACDHDTLVRVDCNVGDFVAQGSPLLSLASKRAPEHATVVKLNRLYGIDSFRTVEQDPPFGIRQLVDIALKALSPGINDTTTAVTCLEHLTVLLTRCATRDFAPPHRYQDDRLRLLTRRHGFAYLLRLAFDQILENAVGNKEILMRVLGGVETIARGSVDARHVYELQRLLDVTDELARDTSKSRIAMEEVLERSQQVRQALSGKPAARALRPAN